MIGHTLQRPASCYALKVGVPAHPHLPLWARLCRPPRSWLDSRRPATVLVHTGRKFGLDREVVLDGGHAHNGTLAV
jgi:hypothetical protein